MENVNEFRKGMGFILKWEGGYVFDPDDPGGETKWGISKRAYPNLDIKNLVAEDACAIYARDYWDRCGCDGISFPLNVVVFDTAVNCGPARAVAWAKDATDAASYIELRKQHYISVVNKNPPMIKFMGGWLNRLNDLKKFVQINTP